MLLSVYADFFLPSLFNCQLARCLIQLRFSALIAYLILVGLERLELSTSRLSGVRSNHLSYRPVLIFFFNELIAH